MTRSSSTTTTAAAAALLLVVVLCARCASGSYPRAQNVTWSSINFKTFLTWGPQPSSDYTYTVEYSSLSGDTQRNPHCIRSSLTRCDLSTSLTDLNLCYTADVLSTPPLGATTDLTEFPHTSSKRFCPLQDTDIGKPNFKLEVSQDKRKTTLYVQDPLTALFKDGRQLNMRDVYADKLMYRVTYRRNKSTGKKVQNSESSVIELTGLDVGESYCFYVQAYIPSRSTEKQLGEQSSTQCSNDDEQSIFDVYSVGVIAGGIILILVVVGLIIGVTVFCLRRRRSPRNNRKEGEPLNAA